MVMMVVVRVLVTTVAMMMFPLKKADAPVPKHAGKEEGKAKRQVPTTARLAPQPTTSKLGVSLGIVWHTPSAQGLKADPDKPGLETGSNQSSSQGARQVMMMVVMMVIWQSP